MSIADLTEYSVHAAVGSATFDRGLRYHRQGRVTALRIVGGGDVGDVGQIVARVVGSRSTPYRVSIEIIDGELLGTCDCPIGYNCKHVAAAALSGMGRPAPAGTRSPARTPDWEAKLRRHLPAATPDSTARQPLALQFTLHQAKSDRYTAEPPVPTIRLTPVTMGARGQWVRTGVAWRELEYARYGRLGDHPALGPLLTVQRMLRSDSGYHGYSEPPLTLGNGGPALWAVLDDLVVGGVPLVFEKTGMVELIRDPVQLQLDLVRLGDEVTIHARWQCEIPLRGDVQPLGDPPFGIFGVSTGEYGPELTLWRLARRLEPAAAAMVGDLEGLTVPADALPQLQVQYLPRLRQLAEVISSDGSVDLPEPVLPRLLVRVSHRPGHVVQVEWRFRYGADDGSAVHDVPLVGDGPSEVLRDRAAEDAALAAVDLSHPDLATLVVRTGHRLRPVPQQQFSDLDAVTFSRQVLPALHRADVEVEIVGTPVDYREPSGPASITVDVSDPDPGGRDWFGLAVTVVVDGVEIPFTEIFLALAQDRPLLLPDGLIVDVDRPEFHRLRHLIEQARALADPESGELRINPLHTGLWEELVALGVVGTQSARWVSAVRGLRDLTELPAREVPTGLQADLRPYQVVGYQWLSFLADRELGGILADDMGLGKTLQALALIQQGIEAGEQRPVLVVAPTSVVGNWAREAQRFAPELRVVTVSATSHRRGVPLAEEIVDADVVITSYALLRIDIDEIRPIEWALMVLDEAQMVKNHRGKTYQAARKVQAGSKIALTGTPMENNLMELWALLSVVAPGLFPDPQRFSTDYAKPIENGRDPELLSVLRRRIRPLLLRRTKELVATELPPKQELVLSVDLPPQHRRLYATHLQRERQKVLGLLGDPSRNRIAILAALTRLRQLALSPALIDPAGDTGSAKIDVLVEHLHELAAEGHRALVFSQFTRYLALVRERLTAEGIDHVYLDGRTRDRTARVAEFTEGTAPAFVISLKAGGVGLNLTEADYCFVLDPWWNPAAEAQAIDRTHRIGQTKNVMVYRLISTDTIEEKVLELQNAKRELFSRIIEDGGLLGTALTPDDLRGLLS